jgi:hypothetical protein
MLPENVRVLLRDHLTSFECLELLLILHGRAEPTSTEALARQSGVAMELLMPALAALESSQLVRRGPTEPPTFRFGPATAEMTRAVDDLERLYRDQRAAVMSEMSINAINRIRSGTLRVFSDAFLFGTQRTSTQPCARSRANWILVSGSSTAVVMHAPPKLPRWSAGALPARRAARADRPALQSGNQTHALACAVDRLSAPNP